MNNIRPRRSVLYMPGSNERALEKAKSLPADALILDLEDAVAPEAKEAARRQVCDAVGRGGYGAREVVIRINALDTPWGSADLEAAAQVPADAILVPKVSQPADIMAVADIAKSAGARTSLRLWAMVETPAAILNAREIAAVAADPASRLHCLVMGTNDLLKESRARALDKRLAVVPWLAIAVLAGRANGLDVIDGVYNDFKDAEGFRAECEQGRTLGMDGKTLIHPAQVEPCNQVFSPSADEIGWARRIIAAFDEQENAGKGVITVDGRMVERLHLAMARRTVAIGEAIGPSA
ncbi:MAG: CoA ester lyase [Pseudomonadota bacterium]|nr:CoA ester lyase [Pseudomonadota bacterium]